VAAYVQGILQQAGVAVPDSLATFQVQHACAGGALAAMSVGALLAVNPERRESGVVICSDIARYKTETTAEVTQGSGAVALHLSANPALLSIDLDTQGFNSRDVDDFFRPIGQVTASVRGGYSMKCYIESFDAALRDHCARSGEDPAEALMSTDMFVLHAPFRNMPLTAMQKILATHLNLSSEAAEEFLHDRGFFAGIDPVSRIGNTYTASLFLSLAFALKERYRVLGDNIVGKRVLLVSYGSGNTMAVVSGRVEAGATEVIRSWDLDAVWDAARPASEQEYDQWIDRPTRGADYETALESASVPDGAFYLSTIREDGYRVYKVNQPVGMAPVREEAVAYAVR
jgi:hydroxymethylglutaryl-CoA synthase